MEAEAALGRGAAAQKVGQAVRCAEAARKRAERGRLRGGVRRAAEFQLAHRALGHKVRRDADEGVDPARRRRTSKS